MALDFQPFDVHKPVEKHFRDLPHWRQAGATYFVTFRLWDSLPASAVGFLETLRRRLRDLDQSSESWVEADRELFRSLKRFLDAGHGECLLRDRRASALVGQSLTHFDGSRYQLGEWTVMPNHVHVIVKPLAGWSLDEVLHSWKSFTANGINRLLERSGHVWQEESYDRLVRDSVELVRTERYVQGNAM